MAEKSIEIKIAATGADQAAQEIGKVTTSLDAQTKQQDESGLSSLTSVSRIRELSMAVGAISAVSAAAGQEIGVIRKEIESIDVDKLRSVSPVLADQVNQLKNLTDAVQNPFEALLKAFTGDDVRSAFASMNQQLELASQQQTDAIDRIVHKGQEQVESLKALSAEVKAANNLLDARDKANGIDRDGKDAAAIRAGAAPEDVKAQRAKDDADKALAKINRDLDEKSVGLQQKFDAAKAARLNADEIASAAPKRAAAAQADLDEFKKIGVEIEKQRGQLGPFEDRTDINNERDDNLRSQELAKKKLADSGPTPQEAAGIKAALALAEKNQKDFEDQKRDFKNAENLANEQRRGIRSGAENTVNEQGSNKSVRLERESQQKIAEEKAQQDKAVREAATAQRKAEQAERQRAAQAVREANQSYGIANDITKAGGNASQLKARAEAVMKNPSAGNQNELAKLLESILSTLEQRERANGGGVNPRVVSDLAHRILRLENQGRNNR